MKILIVEDEEELADTLAEILKRNKYSVDICNQGDEGLEYGLTGIYDCILLDIMLPVMDGITVLKALRSNGISTPIMLLTARSELDDKVKGLDNGADDYLTKPFSISELLARIRSLTRRKGEYIPDEYKFVNIALDKKTYTLKSNESSVSLSLKEFQIMEILIANPQQIISKERFIEKIWGYLTDVDYNNIEVYISFLRKKLVSIKAKCKIKTSRGIGYSLEATD